MNINLRGIQISLAEAGTRVKSSTLEQFLAEIDAEAVKDEMARRFQYGKWDGSPKGDLKTEESVRDHFGLGPEDVAYIILLDGQEMYFQYHDPVSGAKLTEDNWEETATAHMNKKIEQLAESEITELLKQKAIDATASI